MARTKLQAAIRRKKLLWGAKRLYSRLQALDPEMGPWDELTDKEREAYVGLAEATVRAFNGH